MYVTRYTLIPRHPGSEIFSCLTRWYRWFEWNDNTITKFSYDHQASAEVAQKGVTYENPISNASPCNTCDVRISYICR